MMKVNKSFCTVLMFFMLQSLFLKATDSKYISGLFTDWVIAVDNPERNGKDTEVMYCCCFGDTVINSVSYIKIYFTDYDPRLNMMDGILGHRNVSLLCYREEGDKIYRYDDKTAMDIQMYEFNMTLGQRTVNGDGIALEVIEVFPANEITDYSYPEELNAFKLRGIDDPDYEEIWIDRVGSIQSGILKPSDFPDGKSSDLICFDHMVSSIDVNQTSSQKSVRIGINRKTDYDKICLGTQEHLESPYDYGDDVYLDCEFIEDTLHIKGLSSLWPCHVYMFHCHINGHEVSLERIPIDCFFLSNAVDYIEYDIKYEGFEAGIYNINFDSYIEYLSLRPLRPNTTLECYGPVDGINSQKEKETFSSIIHDLQGRRLYTIPERGIYIQNGKKYVVR